ncbi:MAG: winged helix-turn-helix transcriptional regulator [Alphaproteobacteria bacterium]|nr:winged helix-turn-helix transcriptional regulator [Alphaproteobacteria bacterium]
MPADIDRGSGTGTEYNVDSTELAAVAGEASKFLKAIANPDRLQILCMLVQEEMNVSSLEAVTGIRQPRLSQHLARLRRDGLVTNRRNAKEIRYSLCSKEAQEVISLLHQLYCAPK